MLWAELEEKLQGLERMLELEWQDLEERIRQLLAEEHRLELQKWAETQDDRATLRAWLEQPYSQFP